jgi:hypothetical protein
MLKRSILLACCTAFAAQSGSAQFIDPTTHLEWLPLSASVYWDFNAIQGEFGPGGAFEGFRHATSGEVWGLFENYFGYAPPASEQANADPVLNAIFAFEYWHQFSAGGRYTTITGGHVADGSSVMLMHWFTMFGYEAFDGPYGSVYPHDTAEAHFLVASAVPEPELVALIGAPLGLALILLVRRRLKRTSRGPS